MGYLQGESNQTVCIKHGTKLQLMKNKIRTGFLNENSCLEFHKVEAEV
jgi:hypothetical protein